MIKKFPTLLLPFSLMLLAFAVSAIAQEAAFPLQLLARQDESATLKVGEKTYHVDLSRPFLIEPTPPEARTYAVKVPILTSSKTGEKNSEAKNYVRLTFSKADFDRLTALKTAVEGGVSRKAKFKQLRPGEKAKDVEKTISHKTRFRVQDIKYVTEESAPTEMTVKYDVQMGTVEDSTTPTTAQKAPASSTSPKTTPTAKAQVESEKKDIAWEAEALEADKNFPQLIEANDASKLNQLQNHLVGTKAVAVLEKSQKDSTQAVVIEGPGCEDNAEKTEEESAHASPRLAAPKIAATPSPSPTLTPTSTPTPSSTTNRMVSSHAHFSEALVRCTLENMGITPTALSIRNARYIAPLLSQKMQEADITNRREKIHFLSQMMHETQGLKYFSEKGNDEGSGCWGQLNTDPLPSEDSLCDSYTACCQNDNTNSYFARKARPYRSEFRGRGVFQLTRCDNYFAFLNYLRFERKPAQEREKLQRFRNDYHTTTNRKSTKNQVGHFCTPEQINAVKNVEADIDPWNLMNGKLDDPQADKEQKNQNRDLRQQALNQISVPCDKFAVPSQEPGVAPLTPAEFITASAVYFWQANLAREKKEFAKGTIDDDLNRPMNRKNMIYRVSKIVNGGTKSTAERAKYARALNHCIPR